ncbi:MAG: RnfABCDGE type electron transport complex subunit D [Oscillospiraceae bacterium]
MAKIKTAKQLHPSFAPCRDYIFAMLPLIGMATYLYGLRVPIMVVISLATAFVCDFAASLLRRVKFDISDISSYMFAVIFTIMLPATINYNVIVLGTVVVVLLGKHAFGGYGCYPFHPSAFGFAFMTLCIGDGMFMYPKPFSQIGIGVASDTVLYPGIAGALKLGGVPNVDTTNLLLGQYQGPMGTTFCLIILSCIVLLIARRTITWHIPISYLFTCGLWAFAFPRIQAGRLESVMYEMFSGAIIFCAAFIISAPSLAPTGRRAKIAYGVAVGIFSMFYRSVGVYEMGVCFAALLVNPLIPYFDRIFAPKVLKLKGGKKTQL